MTRTLLYAVLAGTMGCPRERGTTLQPIDREVDAPRPHPQASLPPLVFTHAGAMHMEKSELPTVESLINESADGIATLLLGADGAATGCFVSRWRHDYAESHYSTKSGKDESTSHKRRMVV